MTRIAVPDQLAAYYAKFGDDSGQDWIAALPDLAAEFLDRWELTPEGDPAHGVAALVVPVHRADGTRAALKLQQVDDETVGEPLALRTWAGEGTVRLLADDPASGTMLLERLDARRSLASVSDVHAALLTLASLLARLVAVPAPPGLRTLADIADGMLKRVPDALSGLPEDARRLVERCAAAVREVADEPGDRLLHWDLHYENVLASFPGSGRDPWLAIDPKPLAGDPGFELMPALHNRWDEIVATGDVPRAVRRRFDLMTEVVGLDRARAARWTLGRALQNILWAVEDEDIGADSMLPVQTAIADALLPRLEGGTPAA